MRRSKALGEYPDLGLLLEMQPRTCAVHSERGAASQAPHGSGSGRHVRGAGKVGSNRKRGMARGALKP